MYLVTGLVYRVTGLVYLVAGLVYRVTGLVYIVTGLVYLVTGLVLLGICRRLIYVFLGFYVCIKARYVFAPHMAFQGCCGMHTHTLY
jgi:hypothetical protein